MEKAEILESVVHFLRAEQASGTDPFSITRVKRARTEECDEDVGSPCKRQSYHDGMRTCLLQVSNFIASKSHKFGQGLEKACEIHKLHSMQVQLLSTPSHIETQVHLYEDPSQQHLAHVQLSNSCTPSGCSKLAQRTAPALTSSPKQDVMLCDPVWRPW